MSWTRFLLTLLLLCAGATASATSADGEEARVANEGGIGTWRRLADGVVIAAPGYPEASLAQRIDACLAVGYTIQPDGGTSDPVIVKRWSSAATPEAVAWNQFGQAASSALSQWRLSPRDNVAPRPIFTVAAFTFVDGDAARPGWLNIAMSPTFAPPSSPRPDALERGAISIRDGRIAYREAMRQEILNNAENLCSRSQSTATSCVF